MSDIKSDRVELRIKNQREIDFSLWFLKKYYSAVWYQLAKDTDLSGSIVSHPEQLRKAIMKAFRAHFANDPDDIEGRVQRYILALNERVDSFVDLREHQWLRDKLACYWAWFQIRFFTPLQRENIEAFLQMQSRRFPGDKVHSFFFEGILKSPSIYSALSLPEVVIDHPARAAVIQTYFDRLPVPRVFKLALLENLEREFTRLMYNRRTILLPLKVKNTEMCEHAWKYLQKDKSKMRVKKMVIIGSFSAQKYTDFLHPEKPAEKALAAQVLHLVMNKTDEEKILFKERYCKAWEGKVTRLNRSKKRVSLKSDKEKALPSGNKSGSMSEHTAESNITISSEKMYSSPQKVLGEKETITSELEQKTDSLVSQHKVDEQLPSQEDIRDDFDTDIPW
ncbi:hypothetical protein [Citrobacter koseri]|uniref:hypothetical protein n=1 Tax=Citrobacter koseri TaxID=545 RepID=UPI0029429AEF|nr:hypothetical protein [Citrobacter koseri]WOJ03055.1 hypothetical protein R1157_00365 [Citrobacter koseri]